MQDEAVIAHRENVRRGTAPDTADGAGRSAGHAAPGGAVVMHDSAGAADDIDIRWRTAPDTEKVNIAAGHAGEAAPGAAVVMHGGAVKPDRVNIRC